MPVCLKKGLLERKTRERAAGMIDKVDLRTVWIAARGGARDPTSINAKLFSPWSRHRRDSQAII